MFICCSQPNSDASGRLPALGGCVAHGVRLATASAAHMIRVANLPSPLLVHRQHPPAGLGQGHGQHTRQPTTFGGQHHSVSQSQQGTSQQDTAAGQQCTSQHGTGSDGRWPTLTLAAHFPCVGLWQSPNSHRAPSVTVKAVAS